MSDEGLAAAPRRRVVSVTLAIALVGVTGVVLAIAMTLLSERRAAESNTRLELENLTLVMAEHVRSNMDAVDLDLRIALQRLNSEGIRAGARSRAHTRALLTGRRLPQVSRLALYDRNGACLAASVPECPRPGVALPEATDALQVSAPALSPDSGCWEITLSRRGGVPGHFDGTAVAWVDLDFFARFYAELSLGPHSTVLLRDREMRLLARYPASPPDLGIAVPNHHALPFLQRGLTHHTYVAVSAVDGLERMYSFRKAGSLPFYALAGVATSDYLAQWRRHCWYFGILGALVSALLLGLGSLQRRLEQRLRVSREELRLLLDSMSEAAFGLDTQGRCTFANRSFLNIMGYTNAREVIGRPIHSVACGEGGDASQSQPELFQIAEAPRSPQPSPICPAVFRRRDGVELQVEFRSDPVVKDGQAIGAIVTFVDITERQRMLEALQQSEVKFRTLFELSEDAIFLMNGPTIIDCNHRALEMFACRREDLVGQSPDRFSPPLQPDGSASSDSAYAKIEAVLLGDGLHFEWRHRRADGSLFDAEVSLSGFEMDGKSYLHAIIRDVSRRKQVEQQLRIAATAFEAQQAIVITDADARILQVNRAFTEVTGYSAQEAVGQTPRVLKSGRHDAAFYEQMWRSILGEGVWQGEIWNRRKSGEVYPEWLTVAAVKDDIGRVTHFVASHTDITMHKAAEAEIRHLAFYDPLTRLPNRRLLMERLQRVLAGSKRCRQHGALLFIDLDNFKTLNDTLGHDKGDLLLQQVAERLSPCVRESDTVGRLGGDEFLIILDKLSGDPAAAANDAREIGGRIMAALNQPFLISERPYHSTPSIGITLFGEHQGGADELLKQADMAMYKAKATRNNLCFFDPDMQAEVEVRARLESDLHDAVWGRQFVIHFQGQVDREGRLIGAEALLRWQHPERGIVSPAQFIALAEESGLILPLGQHALEAACQQLVRWAADARTAHLSLAVNISPLQFRQQDFLDKVLDALRRTGANPHRLKLELTESMLLENIDECIIKMRALKERGVGLALDDFGTGYSCLAYLKRLPFDQLKIDRSFVFDMLSSAHSAAIARTIVELGNSLGLTVIAEGVETRAQRDALVELGCHAFQGYLFSRPCPIEQFDVPGDSLA
jgi:diguanylate cyclase (GGDEF)-like protein/PAS domain S-box-containing protein